MLNQYSSKSSYKDFQIRSFQMLLSIKSLSPLYVYQPPQINQLLTKILNIYKCLTNSPQNYPTRVFKYAHSNDLVKKVATYPLYVFQPPQSNQLLTKILNVQKCLTNIPQNHHTRIFKYAHSNALVNEVTHLTVCLLAAPN